MTSRRASRSCSPFPGRRADGYPVLPFRGGPMFAVLDLVSLVAVATGLAAPQKDLPTIRTKEAIIKANTTRPIAEAVGQRIDNFCGVFQGFYDGLGLEKKADNKLAARLFNTREEFEQYYLRTNNDESVPKAYFSSALNAIVLYNDEADITLRQTLF